MQNINEKALELAMSNNDIEQIAALCMGYDPDLNRRVKIRMPTYENVNLCDDKQTLLKPKVGEHVYIDVWTLEHAMSLGSDWQKCECTHVHANVWFFKRCDGAGEEFYLPAGCLAWCRLVEPIQYVCTGLNSKYYEMVSNSGLVEFIYE